MPEPLEVALTAEELMVAATSGVMRHLKALRRGAHQVADRPAGGEWDGDIDAAVAELAVAKAFDLYPGGIGGCRHRDVGDLEVRYTSLPHGRLIIRPEDPDHLVFVLVTGSGFLRRIHGSIRAGNAKRPEWLMEPNGRPAAYFVPQDALTVTVHLPAPRRQAQEVTF